MKPLPVAPLTSEDAWIFAWLKRDYERGTPLANALYHRSRESDRRDAELMYRIQVCIQYELDHPEVFADWKTDGWGWVHCMISVALDGAPIGFAGSDITYCA